MFPLTHSASKNRGLFRDGDAARPFPPGWRTLLAVAMVIVIGIIDYLTGYELAFYPFYSIPILFVLWYGSRNGAVAISILSAVAWCCADAAAGHPYSSEWYRVWDAVVRLMFFCLIVAAGTGFRQLRDAASCADRNGSSARRNWSAKS